MDSVVKSKLYKLEDTLHFAKASCIAVDKGNVEFSATLARELHDLVCRGQRRPLLWDVLNYFSISDYVEIIEGTEIRYLNLAENQAYLFLPQYANPAYLLMIQFPTFTLYGRLLSSGLLLAPASSHTAMKC